MREFSNIQLWVFRSFLFTPITPRLELELEVTERFGEFRSQMPPPGEDYVYAYGGESYRAGNLYMSRRDLVYPRSTDYYSPDFPEEGCWGSSSPLNDASNWAHQRSPSTPSRPRGRSDCRDMSYEISLGGLLRSSRFSSPKHSRAGASRRAPSSVRSSAGSCSFTADPPSVRSPVQRSHPVGQAQSRRHGPRSGMRFHSDSFCDPVDHPFPPSYPNEARLDDRFNNHPSLPIRPSPPHLASGPSGRQRFPERGFSESRYSDSKLAEVTFFIVIPRGYCGY